MNPTLKEQIAKEIASIDPKYRYSEESARNLLALIRERVERIRKENPHDASRWVGWEAACQAILKALEQP